jgi:PAS domain S-box-containing protein
MTEIPHAICFKDLQRQYTRLNETERLNLNVQSDADAIGKTSDGFVSSALARARRAQEERALATGEALVDCVEEIAGADGVVRWLSSTKAPIRSPQGEIVGIVEVTRDVTESKRHEQLKKEFIATVSHELRTPLTSIIGSIGYLAGGAAGSLPNPAMRMLKIALGNCHRLIGIVNDILDIEKIESGNIVYDRKPVEARAGRSGIQANRGMADDHDVSVRPDEASERAMVFADPDRLAQVITNLISNAIKFSPRNAEVVVSVRCRDERVHIHVRDHGPGIPEHYKDRIFEKFVQVDATDQRKRGGTGLGLSIAKEIVTQLNGAISGESAAGGGTIFKVELPALGQAADGEPHADEPHVGEPVALQRAQ